MENSMNPERYNKMEIESIKLKLKPTLTDEEREFLLDVEIINQFKTSIKYENTSIPLQMDTI
jgi:hypothetical protein